MADNEYDALLSDEGGADADPYLQLATQERDTNKAALLQSMFVGTKQEPDRAARVQQLSKETKLPAEIVDRNFDEITSRSTKADYDLLIDRSPGVSKFLQNPDNAAVAHDDIDSLTRIESGARLVYPRKKDSQITFPSEMGRAVKTGWNNLGAAAWHLGAAYGLAPLEEVAQRVAESNQRAKELQGRAPDYVKEFSRVMDLEGADVNRAARRFLGSFGEMKRGNVIKALRDYHAGGLQSIGETLDMVRAAVVRPRGLAYSTLENLANSLPSLVTGGAGALAAGPIGFGVGAFIGQVPSEVGAWMNENFEKRGINTTDPADLLRAYKDPQLMSEVRAEAERKGLTTAAVDAVFNAFAGKLTAGAAGKSLTKKAAAGAGDVAIQMAGETSSEAAGQGAAKKSVAAIDWGESVQEGIVSLGHSIGDTAVGATIRGGRALLPTDPAKAAEVVAEKAEAAMQAQRDAQALSEIGATVKESKLAARMPDKIRDLIEVATEGDEAANVYFQKAEWDEHFQGQGLSPAQAAADIMGDNGKAYYEAAATGAMLEIPLPSYIEKVGVTEQFESLLPIARTRPDGMTLKEGKDFMAELPELMDTLAAEAEGAPAKGEQVQEEPIDATAEIRKKISDQLKSTGRFTENEAEFNALLLESGYRAMGERLGMDPTKLFSESPTAVRSGTEAPAGAMTQAAAPVVEGIDTNVETLRQKFKPVDPATFSVARDQSSKAPFLTPYTTEEMQGWKHYLTDDNVGFALTPQMDLVGVFNNSGKPGAGKEAIALAISEGAKTLDAVSGFLDTYYNDFGFVFDRAEPFNDELAPKNWDVKKYGRPDIVFLRFPDALSREPGETATRLRIARDERLKRLAGQRGPAERGEVSGQPGYIDWEARGGVGAGEPSSPSRGTSDRGGQPGAGADAGRGRAGRSDRQEADRGSVPSGTVPLANLPASSPGPNAAVLRAAEQYAQLSGIDYRRPSTYVKADPERGARIAQAFEEMKHAPNDSDVVASYRALADETLAQYQVIKKLGLKIERIKPGMADPYPEGPRQVLEDVRNGHLWFFPTESGFGTINQTDVNPLLDVTGEVIDGQHLLVNDVFRIVHDVFGHAKEGNGFGPHGEENAWQSHVRMYSPLAAKAMTTETRGQNSWVNFGPYGEANRANQKQTVYADQKSGLLPDWVLTEVLADDQQVMNQSAFHGTPHKFDRFSLDAIGSGEGAQVYGWGLYFATRKEVAQHYRDALGKVELRIDDKPVEFDGKDTAPELAWSYVKSAFEARSAHNINKAESVFTRAMRYIDSRIKEEERYGEMYVVNLKEARKQIEKWKSAGATVGKTGRLYSVEVPDQGSYLDWDATYAKQAPAVRAVLDKIWGEVMARGLEGSILDEGEVASELTGRDLYHGLSRLIENRELPPPSGFNDAITPRTADKAASLYLSQAGVPGIQYLDSTSRDLAISQQPDGFYVLEGTDRAKKAGPFTTKEEAHNARARMEAKNFVVFDDKLVTILEFEQRNKVGGTRGFVRFGKEGGFDINLLATADRSTFLHETGHVFLEMLRRGATAENAPADIKADAETILNWFGVKSWEEVGNDQHEQFARGFEAYLMDGKAPTKALREAFARFRAWLIGVYRQVTNLGVALTTDVRSVFDRLVASQAEIAEAEAEQNITPLFIDPTAAGMTEPEAERYRKAVAEAQRSAEEELTTKLMRQLQREQKEFWKTEREKIREDVAAEVNKRKEYVALSVLQTGKMPDGAELPGGWQAHKLSKQAIVEEFGEDRLAKLPRPYVYAVKDGIHPEQAAEWFGYTSGDELLTALENAGDRDDLIEKMTDARMDEAYPDLLRNPDELRKEAQAAVHNEKRSELLHVELQHLASRNLAALKGLTKRMARRIAPIEAVRNQAIRMISERKVQSIRPILYQRAESQAAKEAIDAFLKGDLDTAFEAKQRELMNHELYRAATTALEETDKIVRYMRKFERTSTREKLGKAGASYLEQIDDIMERFDFRKSITLKAIDRRATLVAWLEEQRANGFDPEIPAYVLNDAYRTHYKSMPFGQLQGVRDTVKAIEHLASLKNKLLKAERMRQLDAAIDESVASIEANSKGARKKEIETRLPQDEFRKAFVGFMASHRKYASLARQMDGWKDGGVMWDLLVRPMNEAGTAEALARENATVKLNEIFSVYNTRDIAGMYRKVFIPELNASLTKMGQMVVALNWGNLDNRTKMMDGQGWTEAQVKAVLDRLDERDWKTVQGVWDFIDTYWTETKAVAERVNGVAPLKVAAEPFTTRYGEVKGGYFPLKYDERQSPRAFGNLAKEAAERSMRGGTLRSTTKHGHREARVTGVKLPIRLDFGVIFEHVSEVIHDQTHYEMLIDLNRLMGDKRLQSAIIDHHGQEVYGEMRDAIRDVAAGDVGAQRSFERAVNWLRTGTSVAMMGWNLVTALTQPLGLTQSMVRVGTKHMGRGVGRWIGDAAHMENTVAWIHNKSDFMRLRGKTQMREINEIRNALRLRGKVLSAVEDSYFWMITRMQMVADVPTWLGAYEKAWSQLQNDADTAQDAKEKRAIDMANQAVLDAQGGGQIKDLADIQRGGPLMKLWTNFYSFFNTTLNLGVESFKKTNYKSPQDVGRLAVDLLMLYTVPALLGMALRSATKGGDEDEGFAARAAKEQIGYLMGQIVGFRELSGVVMGFRGYEGPAGTRFFSEFGKLAKQVEQGESDEAFWRAANKSAGIFFHYPATQLERTVRGLLALQAGETNNPMALLFGPPRR